MALPAYEYTPPRVAPYVGGLLTAANIVDVPPPLRFLNGTVVQRINDVSLVPVAPAEVDTCDDSTKITPGPGLMPFGNYAFPAIQLRAPVECDPTVTAEELSATARHALMMMKGPVVEAYFYGTTLPTFAGPGAPDPVGSLDEVLAHADMRTASGGGPVFVHLNAYYQTYLLGKGVIVKSGSIYRTAGGNPVVFGLTQVGLAYLTPPVHILQAAETVQTVLDYQRNDHYTVASQILTPLVEGTPSKILRATFPSPYPPVGP